MPDDLFQQLERRQHARTAKLIGRRPEQQMGWLLKFAGEEDFERMSQLKFRRLRLKIMEFAGLAASAFQTLDNPVSRLAAQQLARDVREGLRHYAEGASWDLPRMELGRSVIPGATRPRYNGRWNDAFLMSAADLLERLGALLHVCAARGCDALFIKHKRKLYCSEKCSARERMRRFKKDVARYRARRRKYYLQSLRRNAGGKSR